MSMERHRCKLCSRIFLNGRALGGHMRSHLATLPLPPKKTEQQQQPQLGDRAESDSSSTHSDHEASGVVTEQDKIAGYGLRENPKKSVKHTDPEFLDAGSVVQDRESETESTQNPTRRRSKRPSQRVPLQTQEFESKKSKSVGLFMSESATESAPVSSVSDASQDEEVALCLMMLSSDAWVRVVKEEKSIDSAELNPTRPATRARFKCLGCKKLFRTNRALAGHKATSKECQQENFVEDQKIYECPFCYKVFGSGQALGGHKRSHILGSSSNVIASNNNSNNNASNGDKVGESTTNLIHLDLNLPAPVEDDEDHNQIHII